MPIVCNCGATLPDDARFCHRCGKPQRDEILEADVPTEIILHRVREDAAPVVTAPPVTFSNPLVLRVSFMVASLSTILEVIPLINLIAPMIGGYISAAIYQRRSGHALTTGGGAKLGWITGIINALMLTIFMTLNLAFAGASLSDRLQTMIRLQASSPAQQQALQMIKDPQMLVLIVLCMWIFFFIVSSLLYMAGGALAARMYRSKVS